VSLAYRLFHPRFFLRLLLARAFVCCLILSTVGSSSASLILPRSRTNPDESKPITVRFRIINLVSRTIYLQGIRQDQERPVLTIFYREEGQGWKPFFNYLPCDLPQCQELGLPEKICPMTGWFPIALGPAGTAEAIKEIFWDGRLYERSEAMLRTNKRGQYCYKSFVPTRGTLHIELEYSETLSDHKPGRIGSRERSAIEFPLPPTQPLMEIYIPAKSQGKESPKIVPR